MHFSMAQLSLVLFVVCYSIIRVQSFVPSGRQLLPLNFARINNNLQTYTEICAPTAQVPVVLNKQRRSVAHVQMMGLFGLGAPEIAVILVAAAFLLGPQKLAELGKDAGKIAGELKEVPKEFQAGLREGEQAAQLAKKQETVPETIAEAKIEDKKE